jgi:hypothetical protein
MSFTEQSVARSSFATIHRLCTYFGLNRQALWQKTSMGDDA